MIDGYPEYAVWAIDEDNSTWNVALGNLTPATNEDPEDFQFEPVKMRFGFESAVNHLFEKELLPQTNLSTNRINPEYRYPLALDTEPTGVKPGTISLALDVREMLHEGKNIGNNVAFNKLCEQHFGGTRAKATFSSRDAYDALELGVNLYLLDNAKNFTARAPEEVVAQ